jgi:hypothetical protein
MGTKTAEQTTAQYLKDGLDEREILARLETAIGKLAERPFDPDSQPQIISILGLGVEKSDEGVFVPDYRLKILADNDHDLAEMLMERRILKRSIARQEKYARYVDHQQALRTLAVAKSRVTAAQLDVENAKIALDDACAVDLACSRTK